MLIRDTFLDLGVHLYRSICSANDAVRQGRGNYPRDSILI